MLFADLSGFTSAAETMDPEEVHAFLEPLMERLKQTVRSYGGTIVNTMGDGFLAVFGAPVAHRDDAERALRAAVAARDAAREAAQRGVALDVHAGVQTGWVFVAPTETGFDIVGDTVNTASRIASHAPAGVVLAGDRTRALASRVARFRRLEPVEMKGKAQPVELFELLTIGAPAGTFDVDAGAPPFVGRAAERRALDEAYAGVVRDGRSRAVVIAGQPGAGKSRLVAEFAGALDGARVLAGRGIPYGDTIPWLAITTALRMVPELRDANDGRDVDACVEATLGSATEEERASLARRLATVLGIGDHDPTARSASAGFNLELASAVRRFLSALALDRPVVLVLEDLQWADAHVTAFLRWVRDEPWAARVLIVGLVWEESLDALGVPADLALGTFADEEADTLLATLLPGAEIPSPVAAEIRARAGGNPLFLQEIVRLLRERGELEAESGRWALVETTRPEVPETVYLVVAARIDDLPPDEAKVLRDAAVCGRSVERSALVALGWDEKRVDELLASLAARGLVAGSGDGSYVFRHAVIRDVAYDGIARMERAAKHLAVAEWIRGAYGEDAVEMLAYHYGRAAAIGLFSAPNEVAPLAVEYLTRAGDRAFTQRAMREAESWYRQALEVIPPSLERARRDGSAHLHPLLRHAETLFELGRYESARAASEQAVEIAHATGDDAGEGEALLQVARLDSLFGSVDGARRLLQIARDVYEEAGDLAGLARVERAVGDTWRLGDLPKLIRSFEEAARMFGEAGDTRSQLMVIEDLAYVSTIRGGDVFERWYGAEQRLVEETGDLRARAALRRTLGFRRFYHGDLEAAVGPLEEALRIARDTGDVFVEIDALFLLARIRFAENDRTGAAELGDALTRLGVVQGLRRTEEEGLVIAALVASRAGDAERADECIARARALLEEMGARHEMVEVTSASAQIALDRGRWDDAARLGDEAAAEFASIGDELEGPRARLLVGRAHLGAGRLDDAMAAIEAARAAAQSTGSPDVLATSAALLASCYALAGRPSDARAMLDVAPAEPVFPERLAMRIEAAALVAHAEHGDGTATMRDAITAWERLGVSVWPSRARAALAAMQHEPHDAALWPYAL